MDPDDQKAVTRRLNRAQGQIGGIVRMLDEGRDCREIITQLAAVSKALDRAGFAIIAAGLQDCVTNPEADTSVHDLEKMLLMLA